MRRLGNWSSACRTTRFTQPIDPSGGSYVRATGCTECKSEEVDVEWSELVYHGARSHVKHYLTKSGWQTTAQTATALYAANGFDLPDDEMMTVFADLSYLSAVLSSRTP